MTKKKDFKRLVRERQEKTGERYTAALAHFRKEPPELGLHCDASASEQVDAPAALTALKKLLEAEETSEVSRAILRGEDTSFTAPNFVEEINEARLFFRLVADGARGLHRNGRFAALEVEGQVVIAYFVLYPGRRPVVSLSRLGEPWFGLDAEQAKAMQQYLLLAGIGG